MEAPSEGDDEEENGNYSEDEGELNFLLWFLYTLQIRRTIIYHTFLEAKIINIRRDNDSKFPAQTCVLFQIT